MIAISDAAPRRSQRLIPYVLKNNTTVYNYAQLYLSVYNFVFICNFLWQFLNCVTFTCAVWPWRCRPGHLRRTSVEVANWAFGCAIGSTVFDRLRIVLLQRLCDNDSGPFLWDLRCLRGHGQVGWRGGGCCMSLLSLHLCIQGYSIPILSYLSGHFLAHSRHVIIALTELFVWRQIPKLALLLPCYLDLAQAQSWSPRQLRGKRKNSKNMNRMVKGTFKNWSWKPNQWANRKQAIQVQHPKVEFNILYCMLVNKCKQYAHILHTGTHILYIYIWH